MDESQVEILWPEPPNYGELKRGVSPGNRSF